MADLALRNLERLYLADQLDLRELREYLIRRWRAGGLIPSPCEWLGDLAPERRPEGLAWSVQAQVGVRPGMPHEAPWYSHLGTGGELSLVRGPFRGGWTNGTDALAAGVCASPAGPEARATVYYRALLGTETLRTYAGREVVHESEPRNVYELRTSLEGPAMELWERAWVESHNPEPPLATERRRRRQ